MTICPNPADIYISSIPFNEDVSKINLSICKKYGYVRIGRVEATGDSPTDKTGEMQLIVRDLINPDDSLERVRDMVNNLFNHLFMMVIEEDKIYFCGEITGYKFNNNTHTQNELVLDMNVTSEVFWPLE